MSEVAPRPVGIRNVDWVKSSSTTRVFIYDSFVFRAPSGDPPASIQIVRIPVSFPIISQ
jgi:hypothetical protein